MADKTECNESPEGNDDEIEEWSDRMCIEISMEDSFPANVTNLTIQKAIINRFLNFYLSGKVQKGLSARDIIFAVIAIMPYSLGSEEFIWRNDQYSDDGNMFFLTPEDRLQTEIRDVMAKHNQNPSQNESEKQDKNNEQNDVPETSDGDLNADELKSEINKDIDTPGEQDQDQENNAMEKTESTPDDIDGATKSNNTDDESSPLNKLIWYRKKPFERAQNQTKTVEYSPVDNSAFCMSCNKLIDKWDEDMTARIQLKYYFGIVALCLMRTIAKSHQHVMNMFTNILPRIIAGSNYYIHYSPPNKTCVKRTFITLRRKERKTHIMFAKIVINSFYLNHKYSDLFIRDAIPNTGGIKNILNATVLAPTADYGMDIVSMLQQIASKTFHQSFREVFELLHSEETAASWNKVNDFLNKCMCRAGYRPTCHWARIIDREQFKYLSCENSYELAVVIAVFIEKLYDNDGVWNARWVKTGQNLETYKQLGLKMYENYKKLIDNTLLSPFLKGKLLEDILKELDIVDC